MSIDITTLRLLKTRTAFERLSKAIPTRALDNRTKVILDDFGRYFRAFPDAQRIEAQPFQLYFQTLHPTLPSNDMDAMRGILESVANEDVAPEIEGPLMERLVAAACAYDLMRDLQHFNEGAEIDLRTQLDNRIAEYDMMVNRKAKNPQVLDPIEDLMAAEENDTGFHWRLGCLNRHIKPAQGGDFIIIAARPDKGKTTFCASELTHWASQVDTLYPNEGRSILWFNNEGPGGRIVNRCFQAALQATPEEMVKMLHQKPTKGFEHYGHRLRQNYATALGGRPGVLRIFNIHDFWNYEVEDIVRRYKPAAILFDMIDNIKFHGQGNNNGERTDQLLEAMYQWGRIKGVQYDCPIIATSQISAEGENERWPKLAQLKDSRTGKQGAADVIITLGALEDPQMADVRFIGCTKNKRRRTGMPMSPMQVCNFNGFRARFEETENKL